jgi:hypothetical protein
LRGGVGGDEHRHQRERRRRHDRNARHGAARAEDRICEIVAAKTTSCRLSQKMETFGDLPGHGGSELNNRMRAKDTLHGGSIVSSLHSR